VAHVSAVDLNGVMQGLGYCHARDRGLQMLLVRILARGRACELLSADDQLFDVDRFFRRLNLAGDSAAEIAKLSPRVGSMVDAYCRGANAYWQRHGGPWELRLMGYRPRGDPWTAVDVLMTAKVIGYVGLAATQGEMERLIVEMVQGGVSRERLEELFPGQLSGLDEPLLRKVKLGERVVPEGVSWVAAAVPAMVGSNNWVVAGTRTASGSPILCNDPHLQINRLPAVWYEAALRWGSGDEQYYAMGASVPGLPAVILGRTADLAWGATYAFMDCVDSWVEECRDGKYRRGGQWRKFDARQEIVRRKKKPDVTLTFFENEHGTLDGDPHVPGHYLATRWSCGEGTGAEALDAMAGMMHARSVEEGRTLLGRVNNSSWNWVLADRQGNIGYQMSGRMPLRREGWSGLVPVPGWEQANDWRGWVEPDRLPRAMNPAEGFLATANEDLNHLAAEGVRPINLPMSAYRAQRIRGLLGQARGVTAEAMRGMQFDLYSVQAERFMALLRPTLERMPQSRGKRVLLEWDLRYVDRSQGAWVFERFYRELMADVFGQPIIAHLWDHTPAVALHHGNFDRVLLSECPAWFGGRSREQIYRAALEGALAAPPRSWGEARQMPMRHLLFGTKLPRLGKLLRLNRGPVVLNGGRATIHQGQTHAGHGGDVWVGPSWRLVTELATDEIWTTLPGGPSDRPWSRWYASGLRGWAGGRYKRVLSK
jgi:penicillin amidase